MNNRTVTIAHKDFGQILSQTFTDATQLRMFLNMIHVSLVNKEEFSIFNGVNELTHIPYDILKSCLIFTKENQVSFTEIVKSKI
jgi:hypothetical protein